MVAMAKDIRMNIETNNSDPLPVALANFNARFVAPQTTGKANPTANAQPTPTNCVDLTSNDTSALIEDTSDEEDEETDEEAGDTFDEKITLIGKQVDNVDLDSDSDESSDGCDGMNGCSQEALSFVPCRSVCARN